MKPRAKGCRFTATGFLSVPGEFADFVIDCIVMVATIALLGFQGLLLPSIFIELVPSLDLLPTWTGCVAAVVWLRKREQSSPAVIDVQDAQIISETPPLLKTQVSPPLLSAEANTGGRSIEEQLIRLNDLLDKKLITQEEYEAKRQQILSEI